VPHAGRQDRQLAITAASWASHDINAHLLRVHVPRLGAGVVKTKIGCCLLDLRKVRVGRQQGSIPRQTTITTTEGMGTDRW
jgi:hypothetical protein